MTKSYRGPSHRHFAGVKLARQPETPGGKGWATEDGRYVFYIDSTATRVCGAPHPVGYRTDGRCPGGVEHAVLLWVALDTETNKRVGAKESLIDVVVELLNKKIVARVA